MRVENKEVDFNTYCEICENRDLNGYEEPCDECLSTPYNLNTSKPINFKEKEK